MCVDTGRDKMLVSATNRVVLTNSGYSILQSLITEHPICRYLISIITQHSARYGDGATALTLSIHASLQQMIRLCESDGRNDCTNDSSIRFNNSSTLASTASSSMGKNHSSDARMRRHLNGLYVAF